MIKSDLYGALARGYCSKKNSSKTLDPDLIEAMADELLLLYCKTQGKLFEEKHCPYEQVSKGIGLDNKVSEVKISCKIYNGIIGTYLFNPLSYGKDAAVGTENKIQECKCEDKTTNYHLTVCCKGMKNEDGTLNKKDFQHDLEKLINCHSKENISKQKILQYLMSGNTLTFHDAEPKDTEQESMIRQSNLTQETKINKD